jgi:hypothetical protein
MPSSGLDLQKLSLLFFIFFLLNGSSLNPVPKAAKISHKNENCHPQFENLAEGGVNQNYVKGAIYNIEDAM